MEGCHEDGNYLNNDISNLYWGTHQQNIDDAVRHNTTAFGEKNGMAELTEGEVLEIVRLRSLGHSQPFIAERMNTTKGNVSDILLRQEVGTHHRHPSQGVQVHHDG